MSCVCQLLNKRIYDDDDDDEYIDRRLSPYVVFTGAVPLFVRRGFWPAYLTRGYLSPMHESQTAARSLPPFCRAHVRDQQPDRQRPRHSVWHLAKAAMRPNNDVIA